MAGKDRVRLGKAWRGAVEGHPVDVAARGPHIGGMRESYALPYLRDKRARFVEEYLVDLNATQAAERAGYSPRTARAQGCRLLADVNIASAIAAAQAARSMRTQITADCVLEELAKIGFANMADYMQANEQGDPVLDFANLTRDQCAALVEVTVDTYTEGRGKDSCGVKRVRFKLADKRAALVDVGKHLGMFLERHSNPDGTPLVPPRIEVVLRRPSA